MASAQPEMEYLVRRVANKPPGSVHGARHQVTVITYNTAQDTVATQDTVTQLVAAMPKVARVVPAADVVIGRVWRLDYSQPGKPGIDWDDPQAKQKLVSDLVDDALAVLAELAGPGAPQRDAAADALGLLALVARQDVEPAEGSDGRAVADRPGPISTVDTQARHTRRASPSAGTASAGMWRRAADRADHRLRHDAGRQAGQHRRGERRHDGRP
jgi:hypothetical protein